MRIYEKWSEAVISRRLRDWRAVSRFVRFFWRTPCAKRPFFYEESDFYLLPWLCPGLGPVPSGCCSWWAGCRWWPWGRWRGPWGRGRRRCTGFLSPLSSRPPHSSGKTAKLQGKMEFQINAKFWMILAKVLNLHTMGLNSKSKFGHHE